jgi:hypothetical protein
MEGGLGDHLLANRFVPAILDKYTDAKIKIFSDTENNSKSLEMLLHFFPSFYQRGGEVIKERANKNYKIISQFGEEIYPAAIENQTEYIKNKMIKECDIFYDLHIDGLNWVNHDYDWIRYYFHFPKPEKVESKIKNKDEDFVLCHLYSRPDSIYNVEQWYAETLIEEVAKSIKVKIITEKQYSDFYFKLKNNKNIEILTPDIFEIFEISSKCSCYIGIDSGIRYIPYHFSKPTFVLSNYCNSIGNVVYSHLIRWLIFKNQTLPMHFNVKKTAKIIINSINNKASYLFPEIEENYDNLLVKRNYKNFI